MKCSLSSHASLMFQFLYFQLYKQITGQLDLPAVVMQFASVRFYTGIVDLSMTAAGKRDPQGLGLHFYHNGQPPEDMQGLNAYMARWVNGHILLVRFLFKQFYSCYEQFQKMEKCLCISYLISPHREGTGSWNISSCKTDTNLSCIFDTMVLMTWRRKEPGHQRP